METKAGFTVNPNVVWMQTPETEDCIDPGKPGKILPFPKPTAPIGDGELKCFQAERTFSRKIGGTVYDVYTHLNTAGRETVLEQFKRLILSSMGE